MFGLDNLPYGAIARAGRTELVTRLGGDAVPLAPFERAAGLPEGTLSGPVLNPLLALGRDAWAALRGTLQERLADPPERIPLAGVEARLPIAVGDYVDFYSSLEHASNLGRMFRPDTDPLLPNWRELPVGYHGRAGSVVVSGTPIRRPRGQLPADGRPTFGPSRRLDIELELGFVTGPGPADGGPIPTQTADQHIFGFCLVNDWSARGIQVWEYQPLGPFLGKSFATSIAAWITPLAALAPFRVTGPEQDPPPLEYLRTGEPRALDLELEVALRPGVGSEETVITTVNARRLYWSAAQQLAHATINGASVRAGDLFASGTISGWEPGTHGCLLEATRAGQQPLRLAGDGDRAFLEDGDEVVLRGAGAPGDGRPTVTLAQVRGRVEPAA